jgi:hypothetical protein
MVMDNERLALRILDLDMLFIAWMDGWLSCVLQKRKNKNIVFVFQRA